MELWELVEKMRACAEKPGQDSEVMHIDIDQLLLEYIDDEDVTRLYNGLTLWFG